MDSAINFKNHLVTDEWNVEIDGKTYWVTRKRRAESPDRDSDWTVESVRPSPNGYAESESHRIVDEGGRTWKRVISAMRHVMIGAMA